MPIEQQLKTEFQQNSKNLVSPPSLDSRIMTAYREHMVQKRGRNHMRKLWKLPNVALIGLIFVLLCGFAYAGGKMLFQEEQGNVQVRLTENMQLTLDSSALEKIRHSLSEVKAQLNTGETAIVYFDESAVGVKDFSLQAVSNPEVIRDLGQWKAAVGEAAHIPASLSETFQFVEGMKSSPFGAFMDLDALKQLDDMKDESKETGKDVVWRKIPTKSTPGIHTYTSVYRSPQQETIYYSLETITNVNVKMEEMTPPSTVYESLDLNGHTAHYTMNNQSLYGASNLYQNIMWIEEQGDQTIIYKVGTDSPTMTKQQLLDAARSL